jgi:hypothetical protein
MHKGFWWGKVRERGHLKDLDVNGRTILKWSLKRGMDMDWIDLAQDRDRWRAIVNAVTNLLVP